MKYLLIACLLFQTNAFAQQKLKYDINKETGDTVYYTKEKRLYVSAGDSYGSGNDRRSTVGDYLKSTVLKSTAGFILELAIQTGRTNSFSIYTGQTVKLMMNDGTVIHLAGRADYVSKKSSMGYGCWIFAFYTLPGANIEALRNGTITQVRVETSMGTFDYPLKEKAGKIIADQLNMFR